MTAPEIDAPVARRRLDIAWLAVVAVTLVYLVIDRSSSASAFSSVAAVVLALVKLRIVLREFMDVRRAPRVLRTLTDGLVAVMGVFLLGTYFIGRAVA